MKKLIALLIIAGGIGGCSTAQNPSVDVLNDAADVGDSSLIDANMPDLIDDSGRDITVDTAEDAVADVIDAGDAVDPDITETGDTCDVPDLPPYEEPAAHVLFSLLTKQAESPFPSNHYTAADGSLLIDGNGHNNSLLYLLELDVPSYTTDAARMKGFALYSSLAFMTSVPVDPAGVPADGVASLAEESAVKLYQIEGEQLIAQQIKCTFKTYNDNKIFHMTVCRPLYTFKPDTSYLFVMTDALKDTTQAAFGRSKGFMQALELARIDGNPSQELLDNMKKTGKATAAALGMLDFADHVIAASVFTTGHPNIEMEDVMAMFREGEPVPEVTYELDQDDAGNDKIYTGSNFPRCSMSNSDMAWGIHGIFHAPEFRNAENVFERGEDGKFKTFPGEDIPFYLMVPTGDGPFPIVIAQHGLSSDEGAMCHFGRMLVKEDIAVLRFLWPAHGGVNQRGNGSSDFLTILNPSVIGANFMQAATEIGSAVILLDQINSDMDFLPTGAADGLPDMDTSRIGYVGTSLGSIIGLLYLPFSDRINIFLSNVGGLGMSHLVEQFVDIYFGGLFIGKAITNLADHIVAAGDGISNVEKILTNPVEWASGPKYVLAQEVIGDGTVANTSTEIMARNMGLKLINPVAVPIEGIDGVEPSTVTSGLYQIVNSDHSAFTNGPGNPITDATHSQALHYIKTGLATGVPEILVYDPEDE
jgi:hypothetical protein